jgi:hypothetical protein
LLSRCVPYVAKRILLNDCKEMVMRCNNPLTALMIGHHISRYIPPPSPWPDLTHQCVLHRWEQLKISRREWNSLTDDSSQSSPPSPALLLTRPSLPLLSHRSQDWFQIPNHSSLPNGHCTSLQATVCPTSLPSPSSPLTDHLPLHRVTELVKDCQSTTPTNQSEKEEVTLILKRQRVAKLVQAEVSLRRMLDLGDSEEYVKAQETLINTFREWFLPSPSLLIPPLTPPAGNSYFGKVTAVVETKEQKRAMDPWIKNLDLGSLLRSGSSPSPTPPHPSSESMLSSLEP